jgi:hypothetical protein
MENASEIDARRAAAERARTVATQDALFEPWARSTVGEPVLVREVTGDPSYWLVPVELADRAIGFVRVTTEGRAVASGALYRHPGMLDTAPAVVTGITAADARERVADALGPDSVAEDPIYVHDGPPGREAWLVRVRERDGATRLLFVTGAGWYERSPDAAGSSPGLEGDQ